jgi:Methyltransferase domain
MKTTPLRANPPAPDYDGLARIYRALEYLAFGRSLEAARFCFLDRLQDCAHLLVLGEGDGRCLARTLRLMPHLRVTCVDASAAMLRRAAGRLGAEEAARVRFVQADARAFRAPPGIYDAIMTLFFLDGFTDEEVGGIIAGIRPSLRPGARWLTADFALPARTLPRWRAHLWLAVLYAFFRWETGLQVRRLPDIDSLLESAGFRREATRGFQGGLLRSSVFRGPGSACDA